MESKAELSEKRKMVGTNDQQVTRSDNPWAKGARGKRRATSSIPEGQKLLENCPHLLLQKQSQCFSLFLFLLNSPAETENDHETPGCADITVNKNM